MVKLVLALLTVSLFAVACGGVVRSGRGSGAGIGGALGVGHRTCSRPSSRFSEEVS